MMREPAARRDQREIAIPSDARSLRRRTASGAVRRGRWAQGFAVLAAGGGLCRRHPGEVLGLLVAIAAVGAVSLNALGSQTGRHPAPILANLNTRPAVAPARKPSIPGVGELAAEVRTEATVEPKQKAEAVRPPAKDGIGDLIKTSESRAGEVKAGETARPGDTTASVTPKGDQSVAKVQRALVKLGYGPLTSDGVMGPGTRAAIAKFERAAKLPVKGEPSGRTLRELASRAGLPPG